MGIRMLRGVGISLLSLMLAIGFLLIPFRVQADDFQIWTQVQFSKNFKPSKFTLKWSTENRLKNDGTQYFLFNTTVGFYYGVYKWFKLGPYYRFEQKIGKTGEQRPFLEVVFAAPWEPVKIKNRQRYEIKIFPGEKTQFRWRNLIQFSHLFKEKPVSYRPFIQDEIFIQSGTGFSENRLDVGNAFGFLQDHIKLVFYYRWQRKISDDAWTNNHILGTSLAFIY